MTECGWAIDANEQMQRYHATEWGKETHDERLLFELLSLEMMQAGLSWQTVLNKRAAFQEDFCNFEPQQVANLTVADLAKLTTDARIIRNPQKINAIYHNAQLVVKLEQQGKSLDQILWGYVDGKPVVNHWRHPEEVPAQTILSRRIAKDLKRLGFKFVGPTIIYSLLEATGIVNDHLESCAHKYH